MVYRIACLACLFSLVIAPTAWSQDATSAALSFTEEGLCVWYGQEYHGKPTASGELFDMNAFTAAHKYLPFGTRVLVTRLDTGRSVEVRINDRGPFAPGRIIDVSFAAAQALVITHAGPTPVRIEVVGDVPAPPPAPANDIAGTFYIQVIALEDQERARQFYETLISQDYTHARIVQVMIGERWIYRVQIGAFASLSQAQAAMD
ncbi:MAG: septal ring lytic transglycosylase RlpA family protein, partial [Desulfovibrio sp.]